GTFKPNAKVSRQEIAQMIVKSLEEQGMFLDGSKKIAFTDQNQIGDYAKEAVSIVYHLGIMNGKSATIFDPKGYTTRGMAAAVLTRMIDVLNPPAKLDFQVATVSKNGLEVKKDYETFAEARKNVTSNQVIQKGGKIIWMNAGIVATN